MPLLISMATPMGCLAMALCRAASLGGTARWPLMLTAGISLNSKIQNVLSSK
jgi:hypothetical protein